MQITWEWLGGFFDGEGSTGIRSNGHENSFGYYPITTLVQTKERGRLLLERIKAFLTEEGIVSCVVIQRKVSKPNWSIPYALQIGSREGAERLLTKIMPYLEIKRTEAQDVLRTLKIFPYLRKRKIKENYIEHSKV